MSKTQRFAQLFILLLGFILGGWGVGTANADFTADMFTGTWDMQCLDIGCLAYKQFQSLPRMDFFVEANVNGLFSFNGSVSDYSDDLGCTPPTAFCTENWSGKFSGGSVFFAAYDQHQDAYFNGLITGGSFSGSESCDTQECGWGEVGNFTFVSPAWGNDWRSVGLVNFESGCLCPGGGEAFVTLTMTTTAIPEPGSTALLGSGTIAVVSFVRWKLGSSHRSTRPRAE